MNYKKIINDFIKLTAEERQEKWTLFNDYKIDFIENMFKYNIFYKIYYNLLKKEINQKTKTINIYKMGNNKKKIEIMEAIILIIRYRKKEKRGYIKLLKNIIYEKTMELEDKQDILNCLYQLMLKFLAKKTNNIKYIKLNEIRKKLIETRKILSSQYVKLIVKIMNKLSINISQYNLEKDDLFNTGYEAVLSAIDNYNPNRNKFITFAYLYILGYIQVFIYQKQNFIRKTGCFTYKVIKILKAQELLKQEERVQTVENISNITGYSEKIIKKILCLNAKPVEIDDEMAEEYEDKKNVALDIKLEKKETIQILYQKIDILSFRDKQILEMRYGINRKEMTLDEIGKIFNVTRERIRQILKNIIIELKEYFLNNKLRQ